MQSLPWYNNDEQVEFSEVLVASGVAGSPEPVSAAYPVAQGVRGRSSKWSTLEFSEPVVAAGEGFYVVFRLPEGSEHTAYGVGGGAGIGYTVGANGYTGWLSQDGEDWVMLDEAFGIAFAPTIIPGEEGMVEKSMDTPDEPPVTQTALLRPFPNPFNPQTRLHFELKSAGNVDLSVYNVRGERVARLASGWYSAGRYDATWRGDDDGGHRVASGAYFARFEAAGVVQTQRLLLVK